MLKCQFHSHSSADPVDAINYSSKKLIDEAAKLNYDVLSITCHRHREFNQELFEYAEKKEILLIPGIEFEINKKHILGINVDESIYKVTNFEQLREFRKKNPHSLIIAPHPFFPGPSLKESFTDNLDCFDAVEYSWAYTKSWNYNNKAVEIANQNSLPIVATSDCHILSYLNQGYCQIDCEKTPEAIVSAIKNGEVLNHHLPTSYFRIARPLVQVSAQTIHRSIKTSILASR